MVTLINGVQLAFPFKLPFLFQNSSQLWLTSLLVKVSSQLAAFKSASVTPLLKKPGLDKSAPANSNINNISKIINAYSLIGFNSLLCNHPTSIVISQPTVPNTQLKLRCCVPLTKFFILQSADNGHSTLLVSLYYSAAFDTIDPGPT